MKLKYRLFLSIFPLSLLLLAIPYFYISRSQAADKRARLENLFTSATAGLSELKNHQEDALKLTAEVLAQDPSWSSVTLSNEKDLLPQNLASLRKRSAIDLLFFASSDGQIQSAAYNADRFALDDIKAGVAGFFERTGQLRKKTGLLSLDDKPFLTAITPVALNGQSGYLGLAVLFPLIGYVHNASGFDSAVSGKSGKWIASTNLSPDDNLKLTNLSSDETSVVSLSGGRYYARLVKFDSDTPTARLALLAPEASAVPGGGDTSSFFFLCAILAAAAATGITWYLSFSISRPLLLVAKAVQEMTGRNSPTDAPASITERNDEVGAVAISFNVLASNFGNELRQKEKALAKLEKYQTQLLELNHRLAKKLYENRVMLSLWEEQNKSEDTKDFLSHILEEILQGLPFHYGCIIIRPLAQIGPEVILARIERNQSGKEGISVTDILERSDRTLWLSSL
ncbi:MAG: HAMP domain-containing protein, partial [Bdellovibrionota bacterium]